MDRRERRGICGESDEVRVAWSGLHKGEEPPISGDKGSGMIFFTGCPLHCAYCQNYQISSRGADIGVKVSVEELSLLMLELQKEGAASLNLVTGTHFIPSIVQALKLAKARGLTLPVVWNSSGYERAEALALIDDYIDLYLVDVKSLSGSLSSVFCGRAEYPQAALSTMKFITEHKVKTDLERVKGTIVRHLVFPGALASSICFLKWFSDNYKKKCALSLMVQFVNPKKDEIFPKITQEEYERLIEALEEYEIDEGFVQELGDEEEWIPDFKKDLPFPSAFATPLEYFLSLKRR